MNTWIQIKCGNIQHDEILILQDGRFYSKSNVIMSTFVLSQPNTKEIICNILHGNSNTLSDVYVVDSKVISFDASSKPSIIGFLNKLIYTFIKPELRLEVAIVKRKDNSILVSFTKGKETFSFALNYENKNTSENCKENLKNKVSDGLGNNMKTVFLENIDLFKGLLEPLFSDVGKRDFYIAEWKKTISLIPDGSVLKEEFDMFESDIKLWFNLLFSWGVKRDGCREYCNSSFNPIFYDVDSAGQESAPEKYTVVIPYWSYITKIGNENKEILITKGLLR